MIDKFSYLGNAEIQAIENLYEQYKSSPQTVDQSWAAFFQGYEFGRTNFANSSSTSSEMVDKEFMVLNLIEEYRRRGHLFTKTNPVRTRRKYFPTLDKENFGLTDADLETEFEAGKRIGIGKSKLKTIIEHIQKTYCESVGVEYVFIRKPEVVTWLEKRMEAAQNTIKFPENERKLIYSYLKQAVGFEAFIHRKFVGQKRFSLEGAEALIPALNSVINKGSELGIEEFVIGMPHRGRLNVLANTLQKPYMKIFSEFTGTAYEEGIELGDVKYHLGYSNVIETTSGKKVKVHLAPNPSHLETVGPVIQGISRAKIYYNHGKDFNKVAPIIIHGDAAVAAQGVVYEVIQMSQLTAYHTGGTIHLVINNQVGFTTNYLDARSSTYSTDIAKVTRSPVFHVNGDDVEALVYTIRLAMEFRQKFKTDVFIDILCYRRYGHNEGDEPRFTQPILYKIIEKHHNPQIIYGKQLVDDGIYTPNDLKAEDEAFNKMLEEKFEMSKSINKLQIDRFLKEDWGGFYYPTAKDFISSPSTGIEMQKLLSLAEKLNYLPEDKKIFKKIVKLVDDRRKMVEINKLDWAMAELLAYASLLVEGVPVRISGQDVERGTFSHRHAVYVLEDSDEKYFPLKHISENQAPFHIYNSLLSEYGVLGFEYGYALVTPAALTIWEAQFGDFSNVAQPIIDQYITSAEEKWGLMNGIVLYLPHGFEGQGPEHSSARIERFMQQAVNQNIQILNCTTPANLFHALRRHITRKFRIPMVIFTPKSLLRHPECVSTLDDLATGSKFMEVIDDPNADTEKVSRVVFCSGKIYYDLLARKKELNATDVALVRLEQMHPFPTRQVKEIMKKYKNVMLSLWVQEEPENMGAWRHIQHEFKAYHIEPVTRVPSASPAAGLYKLHQIRHQEIIDKVFRKCDCDLKNDYCGLQCVKGRSRADILAQHRHIFGDTHFSIE